MPEPGEAVGIAEEELELAEVPAEEDGRELQWQLHRWGRNPLDQRLPGRP